LLVNALAICSFLQDNTHYIERATGQALAHGRGGGVVVGGKRAPVGRRRRIIVVMLVVAVILILVATGIGRRPTPLVRTVELDQDVADMAVDSASARVFIDTSHGDATTLRVFDARSGAFVRTLHPPDEPAALAVSTRMGRIVAARATTYAASVRLLDPRGGAVLHTVPIDPNPVAVLVGDRSGRAYVASAGVSVGSARGCGVPNSSVSVLDARSGRLIRRIHLAAGVTSIAVDERAGRAVVTGDNRCFTGPFSVGVLDATSGRLVRTVPLPLRPTRVAVDEATGRAFVLAAAPNPFGPAGALGRVYVLDTRTGALVRALSLGQAATDIAADERTGRVFVVVGSPSRVVSFTFPPATVGGSGGGVTSGGGMMRMATGPGRVLVLDARSGAPLRTVAVGVNPGPVAVDARRGRVVVANGGSADSYATSGPARVTVKAVLTAPGTVSVLDAATGALKRTIALDTSPRMVVVDERTGHVFVINAGSGVPLPTPDPWAWAPPWLRQRLPFVPARNSRTRTIPSSVSMLDSAS